MKTTKKRRGLKIFLTVLLSIIGVLAVFAVVIAVVNVIGNSANMKMVKAFAPVEYENRLVPFEDSDGNYCFEADRELKVMQLTDVHIGGGFMCFKKDSMALNAVAAMVTAEKPDLVIITGDITYPVPFQAGTFNNLESAKIFAALMETLGVYWAPVFGNHDTEAYSYFSREDIAEFYSDDDLKYCLFETGDDDIDGYGNSVIKVRNSDKIITQALFLIDSHSYTDGDIFGALWKYDNIKESQVNWYKNTLNSFIEENRQLIDSLYRDNEAEKSKATELYCKGNSLLFFHIPLMEYRDAWNGYVENGYADTEDIKMHYGTAGESGKVVYCSEHGDSLFEAMQAMNGNTGTFCGHDHLNNFSVDYKGVRLTYGYSIDYLAYGGIAKIGSQRGCTLISVKPDGTFDCKASNYYQEKYRTANGVKEDVTMQMLNEAHNK